MRTFSIKHLQKSERRIEKDTYEGIEIFVVYCFPYSWNRKDRNRRRKTIEERITDKQYLFWHYMYAWIEEKRREKKRRIMLHTEWLVTALNVSMSNPSYRTRLTWRYFCYFLEVIYCDAKFVKSSVLRLVDSNNILLSSGFLSMISCGNMIVLNRIS
jgi:hypothetical protein